MQCCPETTLFKNNSAASSQEHLLREDYYEDYAGALNVFARNSRIKLRVVKSEFVENVGYAGGMFIRHAGQGDLIVLVDETIFRGNRGQHGGGIGATVASSSLALLSVRKSLFQDNIASTNGGAVTIESKLKSEKTTLKLINTSFIGNFV